MPYGTVNADLITTSDGVSSAGLYGFKNRIINGAMQIDQRNAGASVTGNNAVFGVDRFRAASTQSSKFTMQQNAGAVTPPAGFKNYLGITSSSAYSVLSTDYFLVGQPIEGFNTADLAFGSASAATVTFSFWVRSSLTGTFGGSINNSAYDRSYPFSYTISAANTWEQKTITIAGDTTGTWIGATNGVGLYAWFNLGTGSTGSTTANAWAAGAYYAPTGATSVVGTSGATFYVTGVQLEKGSTATSFDYRDYGRELILCQRYLPAFNASAVDYAIGLSGQVYSTTQALIAYPFIVQPRTAPTGITVSNGAHFSLTAAAATRSTTSSVTFNNGTLLGGVLTATVASGLVAGNATLLWSSNASAQILWTGCEL
jgi:hypothetical protein